jgi:competence protein ComEA
MNRKKGIILVWALMVMFALSTFGAPTVNAQDLTKGLKLLNTGDVKALSAIQGIGQKSAEAIINYRKTQKFTTYKDLLKIKNAKGLVYLKKDGTPKKSFDVVTNGLKTGAINAKKAKIANKKIKKEIKELKETKKIAKKTDKKAIKKEIKELKKEKKVKNLKRKINLNSAKAKKIASIKGISIKIAEAIIAKRKELKGFKSIDDLLKVANEKGKLIFVKKDGTPNKKFEKIKASLFIGKSKKEKKLNKKIKKAKKAKKNKIK